MIPLATILPVDYLIIGHLACDLLNGDEMRLGGTAAYASLTARALGFRVGVVTSWGKEISSAVLQNITLVNQPAQRSTCFKNVITDHGRVQYLLRVAPELELESVPEIWKKASIIHLAPIAQEVKHSFANLFPNALLGLTPQGWLRAWDETGKITPVKWMDASAMLRQASATVISLEDVAGNENWIEEMVASSRVIAVTEAQHGARVYWNGDVRRFYPPETQEIDPTGAGDIFAAAFFIRLLQTRDAWEAGRFATQLASISVTRPGLEGIPTPPEIRDCLVEVF